MTDAGKTDDGRQRTEGRGHSDSKSEGGRQSVLSMAHSVEGNRFQVSAPPPAKKAASQIEKETDVRRSICLLFNPGPTIEAASLIRIKNYIFVINDVVSYERRLWPRASSLIGKETLGARFGNRPLLGFAFRNNTGKM
jgi:hypothetical protein